MNSLKELSSYCKLMLLEVTEDQIQFHRLKLHSEVFSKKERSVLLLLEKLEKLKNEKKKVILDEEIGLLLNYIIFLFNINLVVDNSISEKDLSEKIKEGQFELLIANATNTTKNLIIEKYYVYLLFNYSNWISSFIETNPILQAVYSNESLTEQDR